MNSKGRLSSIQGHLQEPFQWCYTGPKGRQALINNLGSSNTWQILLLADGESKGDWSGTFASREAVEKIIEAYFAA